MTVAAIWDSLPSHFPFIDLDAFVLMPNHIHGIIIIEEREIYTSETHIQTPSDSSMPNGTLSGSLSAIIQNFKSIATRRVNRLTRNKGTIWQRGFHEHIIRVIESERHYENIRRYILENPLRWQEDEENPVNSKPIK